MAITGITITQDNVVAGANLLPIHSPLAFIAEVAYTSTAPDVIGVRLAYSESGLTPFAYYTGIFLDDPSAGVRRFVFIANDAIKAVMPKIDDVYQLNETLVNSDMTLRVEVRFYDISDDTTHDEVVCTFLHAAKQFGDAPNCSDVYANADRTYYCKKGSHVYCYFYDTGISASVDITDGGVDKGTFNFDASPLSGLYKYKTNVTTAKTVVFTQPAYFITSTATIIPIDDCADGKELKWIDRNGMIRFFPFNQFFEISDTPELIGEIQNFVTNIQTAGGAMRAVGYTTKRIYNLTATDADADMLEVLAEIYSSPSVWLRVGANDTAADWLQVRVKGDGLIKRRKNVRGRVDIQVEVPMINNITLV